jgi:hypothetical protein
MQSAARAAAFAWRLAGDGESATMRAAGRPSARANSHPLALR